MSELLASTGEQQEQGDDEEMAFGPTPAYSLSKAAANAAVRTWAPRLLRPAAATAPTSGSIAGGAAGGVRLVAVCPGDVLTRMTSPVSAEYLPAYLDAFTPSSSSPSVFFLLVGKPHRVHC